MIEVDNQSPVKINTNLLEQITLQYTSKDIELIVTSNAEIQSINNENRGINKPTDVLSFPYDDAPMFPLGSIVISYDFVVS